MKYFCCLFLLILVSCEMDNNPFESDPQGLPGTWKLVESAFSEGGPIKASKVKNGTEITFSANNQFVFNPEEACGKGLYQFTGDELIMDLFCDNDDVKTQTIYYDVTFEQDYIKLVPTNPVCIEGCWFVYKKLKDKDESDS